MIVLIVIGLVSAVTLSSLVAGGTGTRQGRDRAAGRRRRVVNQNPAAATPADVLDALVADGVPRDQARLVVERAARHGIGPFTQWLWMQRHGATALAIAVAADLTQRDLLDHLGSDTRPDLEALGLFARYNGLRLDPEVGRPTMGRRVLVDSGVAVPDSDDARPAEPGTTDRAA
ncbi:hypothetical protein GCM10023340_25160 [Nocardioides marinquilinus]|uniref:Uncharacterized protein n=1 Tax=Nocardioides marinquilinus TaxID=1210400 RepID=A0ABP9PP21_9ACTN